MAELRLFGRSAAPGMADGVVTVLGAVKRSQREAGTPAEEALALQRRPRAGAGRSRSSGQRGRPATPATCSPSRRRCCPTTSWPGRRSNPSPPASLRPRRGRPQWPTKSPVIVGGEDAYFSARAADLEDIRDRVLGHLAPAADGAPIPGGSVVVATDLPLSRFLGIDWAQGGAIVLTEGSPTSHVAMLARARRVPMIVGLGAAADSMAGREALVDAVERRSGARSHGGHPQRLRREGWSRRGCSRHGVGLP